MADLTQNPRPLVSAWGRIDKVALTGALILLTIAVFDTPAVVPTIEETLEHFWGTLPYILFAVAAIAWMKASGSERLLDGAFKGRETRMILIGALVGGLSPFCSCQVIPFVAALLAAGAPLSAVMAFWLSSPLMDPAMFAITAGGLEFDFAVAKTVAAVALGIAGGYAVKLMAATPVFADPLKEETRSGGCCGAKRLALKWQFWDEADRRQIFRDNGWYNFLFLGKWLMLAYLLQSLLIAYVPAEMVATVIGGDGIGPILLATIVGAPAYLNGYAAIPLLEGLIGQGMNPGAAMAFVIAGGISSIPAAVAVWALVKPRVFGAYIAFALIGAFAAGLAWSAVA